MEREVYYTNVYKGKSLNDTINITPFINSNIIKLENDFRRELMASLLQTQVNRYKGISEPKFIL